jgi:hypothetical protein
MSRADAGHDDVMGQIWAPEEVKIKMWSEK